MTFIYAAFGLFVGALLNRAADNLPPPARRSILESPRCRYCNAPREWWESSGLVRFLLFRSYCPHCHGPLPLRSPILEFATALLFGYLWAQLGPGWTLALYSLLTALLLLITVVDLEHRLILNVVVLPATLLALFVRPIEVIAHNPAGVFWDWLWGAAIGYTAVFGIYLLGALFAVLMGRLRGRPVDEVAFGFGDVKLAGMVGGLVGIPTIFFTLFDAILLGGIAGLGVLVYQFIVHRRYVALMPIPYGPFFTITAWLFMMHLLG
jgi:leader peptidase (prepilin peptidase) / N-methyltransferase